MTKKQDKNLSILRTKRTFKQKLKAFFIIFKGLSLKQMKQNFLEGEGPTLKQTHLLFTHFLEYLILVLDDNMNDESE